MYDIKTALLMMLQSWFGEPDEPIPEEYQPPAGWMFNLNKEKKTPTVWGVLHAEEELACLDKVGIFPHETPDGQDLEDIIQQWRDAASVEDIFFANDVRQARENNRAWREQRATRIASLRRMLEARES